MNFKRILVLVMALVMVVSACAPAAFAATETHAEHDEEHCIDYDVLENLDLVEEYNSFKEILAGIAQEIEQNGNECYVTVYEDLCEDGYIAKAVEALQSAKKELEGVEITAELRNSIDELCYLLENGQGSTLHDFVVDVLGIVGDINLHVNNAYELYNQDSTAFPSDFDAVLILVEDSLCEVDEVVNEFVNEAIAFVVKHYPATYESAVNAFGIGEDVYNALVAIVVKHDLYTAGRITSEMLSIPSILFTVIFDNADTVGEAVEGVYEVYNGVIDFVLELNTTVEDAIEFVDEAVAMAATMYTYSMNVIVEVFGSLEEAAAIAERLFEYALHVAEKYGILDQGIEMVDEFTNTVYNDILAIIDECGGQYDSLTIAATEITNYIVALVSDFIDYVEYRVYGHYELKDESLYVALGNSPYGEELAAMLNLSSKYFQFGLDGDYRETLATADLITIKLDDVEFYTFAKKQADAVLAELVQNNDKIMALREHELLGSFVVETMDSLGINLDAKAEELNWGKYINDEETLEIIEETLEYARAELLERGVPEYYYFDLQPIMQNILDENGFSGLPGFEINVDPLEVPLVDLLVYTLENSIYAYVKFSNNLNTFLVELEEIAPNATVAIVGVTNPLEAFDIDLGDYGVDFIEYDECVAIVNAFVETFNAQLGIRALIDADLVFVFENDAQAIYDALNVYCDHVYDDCEDDECNRCLAKRVAPGHISDKYVSDNNATCTEDGTESGICKVCGGTAVRVKKGSALGHSWANATCTQPKTCTRKGCEETSGKALGHDYERANCTQPKICKRCNNRDGKALGHKWGEWEILKKPTLFTTGLHKHECSVCGLVEEEVMPFRESKYPIEVILAVIASAIVFSAAMSALIINKAKKRNLLK